MAGRKKTAWERGATVTLIAFALLFGLAHEWVKLAIFIPSGLLAWYAFLHYTYCDVPRTRDGRPCEHRVYGKLRSCRSHRRRKTDAIFAFLRLRNPLVRFRYVWGGASPSAVQPTRKPPESHVSAAGTTSYRDAFTLLGGTLGVMANLATVATFIIDATNRFTP